ncbi:MAG TPA: carboxypeptidase regulatory-like domain-containing protein [Gammaproteobacteria bacterium]
MKNINNTLSFLTICIALNASPVIAYDVVKVADGAAIEGTVVYKGAVPLRKIIPTKDREVCGGPRDESVVRLGPAQGVQEAVVYLKAVAKGKAWPAQETTPVLDNKSCRFEPAFQVVRPGALDIHNSDPVLHNTHGFYGRRTAFNVALPKSGVTVPVEVPRPGLVRVECDAHGWMLAHLFVADNPYYALTGKDGSFSIKEVPPGNYTLVVSQPYLGDTEMAVTVNSGETERHTIEIKKTSEFLAPQ